MTKTEAVSEALSFDNFLEFCNGKGAHLLVEHLRRLCCEDFSLGALVMKGPKFQVECLERGSNHSRMMELLNEYRSTPTGWRSKFVVSSATGHAEPGSPVFVEETAQIESSEKRKELLLQHETVTLLQRAFPGSSVESVRVRD